MEDLGPGHEHHHHQGPPKEDLRNVLRRISVADIPPNKPVSVWTVTPLSRAKALMHEKGISSVLVVSPDEGHLVGILTERDLMNRVTPEMLQNAVTQVGHVMTKAPLSLRPNISLFELVRFIDRSAVRHVPLISYRGIPSGIVTVKDVIAFLAKL